MVARGRREDGHWRAACPAPTSLDTDSPSRDKSAATCRPHGGVGWWEAWGWEATAVVDGAAWLLVHTGHREACGPALQTGWDRGSAIGRRGGYFTGFLC